MSLPGMLMQRKVSLKHVHKCTWTLWYKIGSSLERRERLRDRQENRDIKGKTQTIIRCFIGSSVVSRASFNKNMSRYQISRLLCLSSIGNIGSFPKHTLWYWCYWNAASSFAPLLACSFAHTLAISCSRFLALFCWGIRSLICQAHSVNVSWICSTTRSMIHLFNCSSIHFSARSMI